MAADSAVDGGSAATARDRTREWSVVAVGLSLGALPVLAVARLPGANAATMAPPLLAVAGIVAAGVWLRRREFTPGDLAVVAAWVAASAVVFAVVIGAAVRTIAADPAWTGALATAFMAPIGAAGGLVAGYTDARRRRQHRRARRTRHAVEAATDGVAIIDDGAFATVNPAHAEMYGYDDPGDLVGRPVSACYPDAERRRFETEAMPTLEAGEAWRGEATGERADGSTFPQELTLTPIEGGGYVAIARDVSDRREREGRLRRRTRRLRTVVENAPIVLFAVDDDGEILCMEGQGLSEFRLDPVDLEGTSLHELGGVSDGVETAARRALEGESGHATARIDGRVLKTWFRPVVDGDDVDRVVGAAMDVTDSHERERRLTELHDASRRLTYATTRTEVAETTVEIAAEALGQPVAALWRYDAAADRHRPIALSEGAAESLDVDDVEALGPIAPGDAAMAAFRDRGPRRVEDGSPFQRGLGTVVAVPLGDQGLLVVGHREERPVDEAFLRRAAILGLNAGAALERADREELHRERTEELRTRASQMEFVNSILRHDVFNGMTVIRSRASFLAETGEGREREYAETIIEWCDNITGLVGRVRTVLTTLSDEESAELEVIDAASVLEEEVARIERTYPDVDFEVDVPETVPVRADEVLADIVQNLVTNAVEHNDREDLVVSVSAAVDGDRATIRVADNGTGIPPDRQDAVFGRGESGGGSAGSGFGLFFVRAMVEAYDGDVRVENDDGAVFTIELPVARNETHVEGTDGD